MHRSRTSGLVAATVMSLIFVASVACTSGTHGGSASSGPSLSAPSPDARTVAEANALETYRGMWRAYVSALASADPDSPALRQFAAGDALTTLVSGIAEAKRQGLVGTGDIAVAPRAVGADPADRPERIDISDCVDTSKSIMVKRSGETYRDTPGGRRLMTASVKKADGSWRVVSFGLREVGSCS